ncbi:MAG: agmatinase [Clostridia bacterium]|nr:agmatinase [Clostridia bacterium]
MTPAHNLLTFINAEADFAAARLIIFGAPFDATASFRPGSRFAPAEIRTFSQQLETYSPYQERDLSEISVCDIGDLTLAHGNAAAMVEAVREQAAAILAARKIPLLLGGEHLVSLGAVQAAAAAYPDLLLLHLDAHTDLRDDYLGERLSHATVIRRCHDILGDGRIFQFGIRSGERDEFLWSGAGHTHLRKFDLGGISETVEQLQDRPLYLTVDLDILDPSVLPGTGTPEAGGISFEELRAALTMICREANIIACDMTELCPPCDPSGASTAVAAKILREMLLALG